MNLLTRSIFRAYGRSGYVCADGPVGTGGFLAPTGVALDNARGVLYVMDQGCTAIRVLNISSGAISTLAGGCFYAAGAIGPYAPVGTGPNNCYGNAGNYGSAYGGWLPWGHDGVGYGASLGGNAQVLTYDAGRNTLWWAESTNACGGIVCVRRADVTTGTVTTVTSVSGAQNVPVSGIALSPSTGILYLGMRGCIQARQPAPFATHPRAPRRAPRPASRRWTPRRTR